MHFVLIKRYTISGGCVLTLSIIFVSPDEMYIKHLARKVFCKYEVYILYLYSYLYDSPLFRHKPFHGTNDLGRFDFTSFLRMWLLYWGAQVVHDDSACFERQINYM